MGWCGLDRIIGRFYTYEWPQAVMHEPHICTTTRWSALTASGLINIPDDRGDAWDVFKGIEPKTPMSFAFFSVNFADILEEDYDERRYSE